MKTLQDYKEQYDALKFKCNLKGQAALEAVKKNPFNIVYVPASKQTEEMQMAAVQQEGWVIQFIQNPREHVQLAAVERNGWAIQWIHNPSDAVQLVAVQQEGWAIQFIQNPSETLQLAAVQQDGRAIEWIHNPSERVILTALEQDTNVLQYIDEAMFEKYNAQPNNKKIIVVDGIKYQQI